MRLAHQDTPSQRPPLHSLTSSTGLSIVNDLKLTKSRKTLYIVKSCIQWFWQHRGPWCQVVSSFFDNDVLFVLPSMAFGVLITYSCSMDDMDKMWDSHPCCTTKTTNIQNGFGLSFWHSTCLGHFQCHNKYFNYMHCSGGICTLPNGQVQLLYHFPWSMVSQ